MSPSYYTYSVNGGGVDPVACLALIVSIGTLGWTVWCEFTGAGRRRADEYWYRSVLAPNCIEPLIDLMNEYVAALATLNTDMTFEESQAFCDSFAQKKERLLARLWISKLFSSEYYDQACLELDHIDDFFVQTFGAFFMRGKSAEQIDFSSLRDEAIARISNLLREAYSIEPVILTA